MCDEGNQIIANFPDLLAQPPFELLRGRTKRQIGLGADQIDHGLGLRQVHFSIQKCALGKFARPRRRAPARRQASRTFALTSAPPWQLISTRSSPV